MLIYIAHRRRKNSNALDTLVLSEQECFRCTSERLVTTRRITEVSRQRIQSHRSSDSEGPTSKWAESVTRHKKLVTTGRAILVSGWPLSRQCEIPWQFHDISLTAPGTPSHVKCYSYHAVTSVIVSGGGRNATVHDPKPKWNAQAQQSQERTQICS